MKGERSSRFTRVLALALGSGFLFVTAAVAWSAQAPGSPNGRLEYGAISPPERALSGVGERSLIIVVGGEFASEAEASDAAQSMSFGDVEGFYVDAADNYEVLGSYRRSGPDRVVRRTDNGDVETLIPPVSLAYEVGLRPATESLTPGRWILVSAFRTMRGAEEFMDVARAATGRTDLVALRVRKLGGGYVGLGQEPHPDGAGPLRGPLPNPERYQQ